MKSILFSILFASSAFVLAAADAPSVTGQWQVHINIADNESDSTCNFTQKGNDFTGTCTGQNGQVNVTGKVDGKDVSWTYKSEYNGGPITLTYKGKLQPTGKMGGSVSVEEYGADGDFTATKSQ